MALLRKCLSPQQRLQLEQSRSFQVTGSRGGSYVIHVSGIMGNVHEYRSGVPYKSWCIYLPGAPAPDTWLSQKLLLETDEGSFRKIAY